MALLPAVCLTNPVHSISISPYCILRLHIRSLGYQQLSSGGTSTPTCIHQRRVVVLNQAQSEGEVGEGSWGWTRLNTLMHQILA
jgi:hypothetical protein